MDCHQYLYWNVLSNKKKSHWNPHCTEIYANNHHRHVNNVREKLSIQKPTTKTCIKKCDSRIHTKKRETHKKFHCESKLKMKKRGRKRNIDEKWKKCKKCNTIKLYRNLKNLKMNMTRMGAFSLHRCIFISFLGKPTYFLIQQWALVLHPKV